MFEQRDTGNGGIGRDQLAEVLVQSLLTDAAVGRTFELFAEAGPAPTDWDGLFAGVRPDPAGSLDAGADPDTLPAVADEPAPVPGRHRAAHGPLTGVVPCSGWNWSSSSARHC